MRYLRNKYLKEQADEINEARMDIANVKMWRKVREHGQVIKKKPKQMKCEGLREHFKEHFDPDHTNLPIPEEIRNPPTYVRELQNRTP